MFRFTALVTSALIAAAPAAAEIVKLTPAQQAKVRAGVAGTLKDPPSARFGIMRAGREGGEIWVCGRVNAKNSYGGYTGMGGPDSAYMGRLTASGFIVEEMGPRALGHRCGNLGVVQD